MVRQSHERKWNSYSFGASFIGSVYKKDKSRSTTSSDVKKRVGSWKIQDFWNGSAQKHTLIYDFFSKEDRAILESISLAIKQWEKRERKLQKHSSTGAVNLSNVDTTSIVVTDSELDVSNTQADSKPTSTMPRKGGKDGARGSIIKIDTAATPQVVERNSSGVSMRVPSGSPGLTYSKTAPLLGELGMSDSEMEAHQPLPIIEEKSPSVGDADSSPLDSLDTPRGSVTVKTWKSFAQIDIGPVQSPVNLADFQKCVDKAIKNYMKNNPDRPWKSGGDNLVDQPVLIYEHVGPRMALVWDMWKRMKDLKGKHEQWITAKLGDILDKYGVFGEEVAETLSRLYVLDDKEKDKWKLTSMLSIKDLKSFLEAFHFMLAYRPPSAMADFSNSDDIYGRAYMCTSSKMLAFTVCFCIFAVQFISYYLLTTLDYGEASPRDIDDNVSLAKFCALLSLITFLIQDFWGSNLILAHGIYTSYYRINPRIIFPLMQLATVTMGFLAGVGGISRSDNVWDVFDNVVAVAFLSELDEWCVRHIVDDIREVNLNPPVSEMYWHLRYTLNHARSSLEAMQNIFKSWRWSLITIQIIGVVGCIFAAIIAPLFNTIWEACENSDKETWFWVYIILTFFLGPVICMGIMMYLSPLDKKQTRVGGTRKGVTKQILNDMEHLDSKINSLENALKEDNQSLNKNTTEKINDNKNRLQEHVETFQLIKQTLQDMQTEGKERMIELESKHRVDQNKFEKSLLDRLGDMEIEKKNQLDKISQLNNEIEQLKEKIKETEDRHMQELEEKISKLENEHIAPHQRGSTKDPSTMDSPTSFDEMYSTPEISPDIQNKLPSIIHDLLNRIVMLEKDNTDQNRLIIDLIKESDNKEQHSETITTPAVPPFPDEISGIADDPSTAESPSEQTFSPRNRAFAIPARGRNFESLSNMWQRRATKEDAQKSKKRSPRG